jgi:hypothetical protein
MRDGAAAHLLADAPPWMNKLLSWLASNTD